MRLISCRCIKTISVICSNLEQGDIQQVQSISENQGRVYYLLCRQHQPAIMLPEMEYFLNHFGFCCCLTLHGASGTATQSVLTVSLALWYLQFLNSSHRHRQLHQSYVKVVCCCYNLTEQCQIPNFWFLNICFYSRSLFLTAIAHFQHEFGMERRLACRCHIKQYI